jgi:hypothetical protein
MIVELTEDSQRDLLRSIAWFERMSPGLGDRFELEFYNALNRIMDNPYLFPANQTGFRPCRLKRFTSVVYFRTDGDLVVIVGLFTSGEDESDLKAR